MHSGVSKPVGMLISRGRIVVSARSYEYDKLVNDGTVEQVSETETFEDCSS